MGHAAVTVVQLFVVTFLVGLSLTGLAVDVAVTGHAWYVDQHEGRVMGRRHRLLALDCLI